jgi:hypothetical protein
LLESVGHGVVTFVDGDDALDYPSIEGLAAACSKCVDPVGTDFDDASLSGE